MKNIKILGISSSPRYRSNTEILINEALKGAATLEYVETKYISLRGKRILPCIACNRCPVEDTYCAIKDDMLEIYKSLIWANGIILGTPVYFQTLNAQMKIMMDRCRPLGRMLGNLLRYKVGGAITVGGGRNHGQEYAINAMQDYFNILAMATVGGVMGTVGVMGFASSEEKIHEDVIHSDFYGDYKSEEGAYILGKLVAICARVFTEGSTVVNPDILYNMKTALIKNKQ